MKKRYNVKFSLIFCASVLFVYMLVSPSHHKAYLPLDKISLESLVIMNNGKVTETQAETVVSQVVRGRDNNSRGTGTRTKDTANEKNNTSWDGKIPPKSTWDREIHSKNTWDGELPSKHTWDNEMPSKTTWDAEMPPKATQDRENFILLGSKNATISASSFAEAKHNTTQTTESSVGGFSLPQQGNRTFC